MSRYDTHDAIVALHAEIARLKEPGDRAALLLDKNRLLTLHDNTLRRQEKAGPATIDEAMLAMARTLKIQTTFLRVADMGAMGDAQVENAISGTDNFCGGPDTIRRHAQARARGIRDAARETVDA